MFPICCPYVQKCSLSMREWPHLPICVSHMLKLGPYVDLFFAICYHILDNIWATYNLVVFENTQHMGHIWAAYGPHMGCPYVAHMWPICFGRSSGGRSASSWNHEWPCIIVTSTARRRVAFWALLRDWVTPYSSARVRSLVQESEMY